MKLTSYKKITSIKCPKSSFFKYLFLFLIIYSCNDKKRHNNDSVAQKKQIEKVEYVETIVVKKAEFDKQIISNGKLYANRKNSLRFRSSGKVTKIFVQNGDLVKKGQKIAVLDRYDLNKNLIKAQNQLQKAEIDFKDGLIGQGIDPNHINKVPDTILKNVKIRSGYIRAKEELVKAEYDLNKAVLRAPFNGVIANLHLYEGNYIDNSKSFCDVIENDEFEIQFPIMETELSIVKPRQKVIVIPYANPEMKVSGLVTEINPSVNEHGSAQGYAIIKNFKNELYEGMNVKLFIGISLPNKIIIPKKAVVTRSQREVVFTYEKGLARWNYVETGLENANEVVIVKGIRETDTVIVSGNSHLANDTSVKIKH